MAQEPPARTRVEPFVVMVWRERAGHCAFSVTSFQVTVGPHRSSTTQPGSGQTGSGVSDGTPQGLCTHLLSRCLTTDHCRQMNAVRRQEIEWSLSDSWYVPTAGYHQKNSNSMSTSLHCGIAGCVRKEGGGRKTEEAGISEIEEGRAIRVGASNIPPPSALDHTSEAYKSEEAPPARTRADTVAVTV